MKLLELNDVAYRPQGSTILDKVNLSVDTSDFLIITGPSGSGKSTLLRLIDNLISPTFGEILYKGKGLSFYNPVRLRKEIILCFQMPHLFGDTVYDNLAFPFNIRKIPPDHSLIINSLKLLNLDGEFLNKDIRNLSGGEKQRVSLIRSLMFKPDILLLDEVTSALDEENTHIVEETIINLNNQGTTVLWVTHNMNQAERLGHRHIHIENGCVREV